MPFCTNCNLRVSENRCTVCGANLPSDSSDSQTATSEEGERGGAPLMFASLIQPRPSVADDDEYLSAFAAANEQPDSTVVAPIRSTPATDGQKVAVATAASPSKQDQLGSLPRLSGGELDSLMRSEAAAIAKAADVKQVVLRMYGDRLGGKVAMWVGLFGSVDANSQDEFIDNFVANAVGVVVDRKRSLVRKSSGIKYTCHPMSGHYKGAVCTWTGKAFFGAVVSLSGLNVRETIKLAQASWSS